MHQGFRVSHLPCIDIEPIASPVLKTHPAKLVDAVLFTSANAVACAHAILPLPWSGLSVHAIGAATQSALQALGQTLSIKPRPPYNSEAYLNQMKAVAPGRLMIIKGAGGRELIEPQLQRVGWQVYPVDVYRRMLPAVSSSEVAALFAPVAPDIISVTSNEGLRNLLTLTSNHQSQILQIPLVVNSQRGARLAISLGFSHPPLVAEPPGDTGQLTQLTHWQSTFAPD